MGAYRNRPAPEPIQPLPRRTVPLEKRAYQIRPSKPSPFDHDSATWNANETLEKADLIHHDDELVASGG